MAITQGSFQSYDFNRMVVLFTMVNEKKEEVSCAISTEAMDFIEGTKSIKPAQREAQYLRLRSKIDAYAEKKLLAVELEGNPPGIVLRSIDFRS